MIYFKRRLHTWLMHYAEQHRIKLYELLTLIVLKWAKEHGFRCEHHFEEPRSIFIRNNREYYKCVLCGDLIPREQAPYIRYDRLYPDLSDLV